jgi:hypothetical protein
VSEDYQQLLERAKEGVPLTPEELAAIRAQLTSGNFAYDPYTLLHILGKAGDVQSRPIVERYLDLEVTANDPMLRRIALQVMGRMWALPEAFDVAVEKAINDPDTDVRAAAATVIGFLGGKYPQLQKKSADVIVKALQERSDPNDYVWSSFYFGLLELLHVPMKDWPSPIEPLTEAKINRALIHDAQALAHSDQSLE